MASAPTCKAENMTPILDKLTEIYDLHAARTAQFRQAAACAKGCAFCCTDAGRIDITTLEGLRIRQHLRQLPRPQRAALENAIARDARRREKGRPSPCPFLLKNMACRIYDIRPFACRRIYSMKRCGPEQPPLLHREAMAWADEAIASLQAIDPNGYTGHISYILHMLDTPAFLTTYLAGAFKPEAVMMYGKTHGIVINRMMVPAST